MSFITLPREMFLGLDGASASLPSQSLYKSFLGLDGASASLTSQSLYKSLPKVDSDGGPLNFTTDSSQISLELFFSFAVDVTGFSLDLY